MRNVPTIDNGGSLTGMTEETPCERQEISMILGFEALHIRLQGKDLGFP